jgi:glycosyltransferase involved in cell wall biosynthesis
VKVAIVTSFYASSILDEKEIRKRSLCIQHPHPWIKNLAEALAKRDVDIHVVTISNEFNQDYSFKKNNVIYDFLKSTGKIKRVLSLYESDKLRIHSFLKKEGFDIVHGQGLNMFGYYAVTSEIPHVLTIHLYMTTRDRLKEIDRIHLIKIYLLLLSVIQKKIILKRTKHAISISRVVRKILVQKGLKAKIHDIENPVCPDFFLKEQSLSEDYCLYVGSLTERKNVLDLVKALEKTKMGKLKIISQTVAGEYYSQIKKYVENNNLLHRVVFLGHKRNNEIVYHLKKSMFLVLPSMKEMAPMVISEAMAAGKPVIATAIDGIPYMIKEGETGFLVPPGNSQKLAEKMELLFANRDLCQKMGRKARREAENRWYPDMVAEQTILVYQEIIKNWQNGK